MEALHREWVVELTILAPKHLTLTVGIIYECLVSRLNVIIRFRGSLTLLARSSTLFTNFRLHQHSLSRECGLYLQYWQEYIILLVLVKGAKQISHTG